MPADPDRVKSLFLQAVERPPADQSAFVAAIPDPDERAELHRLLLAHRAPDARLDQTDPHPTGDIGQEVAGRYKLLERIGEGGMGTVWMAEQRTPVKRLVALKLIKPGLDTKAVLARFEAERQALAIMDHPSIARVLDAGETADGRPFFVMELVKGVPITRFCDEARLTPRQRLELFVPVCQAIQHAHQKGVIHRDIKPGNVLVALYDGRPVPKVIDFGVAKAAGQPLTEKTLHTGFGAVVGTPEYMSPEQASFNQLDVDTRSDVYSLGVLLYELLTGGPPFSGKELERAGLLEMLRVVREQEPPRPSVKLSTAAGLASLAATRGTEPARLAGLVRGEVDWIVMKALEKDRNRRYETALGLAADVSRHLAGEPVQAVPPSVGYRVRKFIRRHRGRVAAAAVVALALLVGAAAATWQAVRAEQEWQRAMAAQMEALVQAEAAKGFAAVAGQQTRKAELAAAGYRVDLDLATFHYDSRGGLLKLLETRRYLAELATVRPGDKPDPEFTARMTDLRDLITLVLVAGGQNYAPLLPLIPREVDSYRAEYDAPDGLTYLSLDSDSQARLFDLSTMRRVGLLSERGEQAVRCGYSPDGKTLYTLDVNGVVRLWNPDGTLRAKTPLRADRFRYPDNLTHREQLSLAESVYSVVPGDRSVVVSTSRISDVGRNAEGRVNSIGGYPGHGPIDLYDTASGRPLARLSRPDRSLHGFRFSPGGKLLTAVEIDARSDRKFEDPFRPQVVVWAADTGRELARLDCPEGVRADSVTVSPTGRWLFACSDSAHDRPWARLWDAGTWAAAPFQLPDWLYGVVYFLTDELLARDVIDTDAFDLPARSFAAVHRLGGPTLILRDRPFLVGDASAPETPQARAVLGGERILYHGFNLLDGRTLRRLAPPPGRRVHPDLARVAAPGRFVGDNGRFVDTRTDKEVDVNGGWYTGRRPDGMFPGASMMHRWSDEVRLLPADDRLDVPTEPLERWFKVAVRGELGPDGEFVRWDEATWRREWEKLATMPPPFGDFPLPGQLARDPLHWLRKEFDATEGATKIAHARELLRRAEAAGDAAEAARWRREVRSRVPEVAPRPRPVVN